MTAPVVLLGIMRRSGTNYLWNLLAEHPDLVTSPVVEDYALAEADALVRYAERMQAHWSEDWALPEDPRAALISAMGEGILRFLGEPGDGRRLLTRTPSVANLSLLTTLFPAARRVIVVRDGRDVVASGMKSFGWNFETAAAQWAREARRILAFVSDFPGECVVVRFEDIQDAPRQTLSALLTDLDLPQSPAVLEAPGTIPIKGSSSLRSDGGALHWSAVAPDARFRPVGRWADWSRSQRRRFAWIAGPELAAMGYPEQLDAPRTPLSPLRQPPARAAACRLADVGVDRGLPMLRRYRSWRRRSHDS